MRIKPDNFKDYTLKGNTLCNKIISAGIFLRCRLTESIMLLPARCWYSRFYEKKNDTPMISIIIATYNRGRTLVERTIPAILAQTYRNFEIIIVGDHCIDNTAQLLKSIPDPRIRFYDLPARGKYPRHFALRWFVQGVPPRNKGLDLARGQWLAWMSDDDVILPHHFETLLGFARQGDYEFVSAAYTFEKHGQIYLNNVAGHNPRVGGLQTWLYRSYLRLFRWNIQSWRKYWDRPCDADLQVRMHSAGVRMGFIDKVVAHIPATAKTDTVGYEAQKILSLSGDNPV